MSSITLGELYYGAEKSARRIDNLHAIEHFTARLEILAFAEKAAATMARSAPDPRGRAGGRAPTT